VGTRIKTVTLAIGCGLSKGNKKGREEERGTKMEGLNKTGKARKLPLVRRLMTRKDRVELNIGNRDRRITLEKQQRRQPYIKKKMKGK